MTIVRVVAGLILIYLGLLLAVGCYVAMLWQINPWPGNSGSTLRAVGFGISAGAFLVAPMVSWWFLVPRAAWLGVLFVAAPTIVFFLNT